MNRYVLAWVLLSGFGSILSLYLTRESFLDLRALGLRFRLDWRPWFYEEGNGRLTAARSRLIRESLRVTVHLGYLLIGLPALHSPERFSIFVVVLMWGNAVLVINSLIDARARRLLWQTRGKEPAISH